MPDDDTRAHPFRIGILGGMGPEAGILLQQVILRETPASRDQDHLAVVTFTNPHVPDRTESLATDGGTSYLCAVIESLRVLERTDADILIMACNTAHARLGEIREAVSTPILDMVGLAKAEAATVAGCVGILATDGTVNSGLFHVETASSRTLNPPADLQKTVMAVIRGTKAGEPAEQMVAMLRGVVSGMMAAGCARLVLGCTELSIHHDALRAEFGDVFIDPLRLAARRLVEMGRGYPRPGVA